MTIIIPMAGLSSRFTKAGYILPKYMLYAVDRSLFNVAVSSFEKYFKSVVSYLLLVIFLIQKNL